MGRRHWLLDLEVGGLVVRLAGEALVVVDAAGTSYEYAAGLADPGISLGSVVGVGEASVAVIVETPTDWALLVSRGYSLDQCPAVLRRWEEGTALERARVVIRGRTSEPVYGAVGDALTFSISRSIRADAREIPGARAVVDDTTWPPTGSGSFIGGPADNAIGATYPLVIGCPGGMAGATPYPVVPVPIVEYQGYESSLLTIVIRTAWLGGHASAVRVRVVGKDPPLATPRRTAPDPNDPFATPPAPTDGPPDEAQFDRNNLALMEDAIGREMHVLTEPYPFFAGEVGPATGWGIDKIYIGFRDDTTYGGGILTRRRELMRGAGDVIEWVLLDQYTGKVDKGRLAAVRGYLNRWKIDTYINSQTNAWDWLESEILPLVPVEMREGAEGIYPAVVRYDLTASDARGVVDATPGSGNASRASSVSLTGDAIANELSIEFRPTGERDAGWLERRILTARPRYVTTPGIRPSWDATTELDYRVAGSPLCAVSQARYGVKPLDIKAGAVWDVDTALLTLRMLAARLAWPRRKIRYETVPDLERLEVGDAVLLTDPDLYLDGAVAVVYDSTPGETVCTLDLMVLDNPVTGDL